MSLECRKASNAYFRVLSSLFSSHHLRVYPVSAKWKHISTVLCYCGSDPFTTVGSEVTCAQSPGWVSGASSCDASLLVKQARASRNPLLLALVFLWWRIPEGGRKHPRMLNAGCRPENARHRVWTQLPSRRTEKCGGRPADSHRPYPAALLTCPTVWKVVCFTWDWTSATDRSLGYTVARN